MLCTTALKGCASTRFGWASTLLAAGFLCLAGSFFSSMPARAVAAPFETLIGGWEGETSQGRELELSLELERVPIVRLAVIVPVGDCFARDQYGSDLRVGMNEALGEPLGRWQPPEWTDEGFVLRGSLAGEAPLPGTVVPIQAGGKKRKKHPPPPPTLVPFEASFTLAGKLAAPATRATESEPGMMATAAGTLEVLVTRPAAESRPECTTGTKVEWTAHGPTLILAANPPQALAFLFVGTGSGCGRLPDPTYPGWLEIDSRNKDISVCAYYHETAAVSEGFLDVTLAGDPGGDLVIDSFDEKKIVYGKLVVSRQRLEIRRQDGEGFNPGEYTVRIYVGARLFMEVPVEVVTREPAG